MQMFRARCNVCGWTYDTVVLPMPITEAARVIGASHCPMCANHRGNTCAAPRDLTDAERVHKARLVAHIDAAALDRSTPRDEAGSARRHPPNEDFSL